MIDRKASIQALLIVRLNENLYIATDADDRDDHVIRAEGASFTMLKAHNGMTYDLACVLDRIEEVNGSQTDLLANAMMVFEGCVEKCFAYHHERKGRDAFTQLSAGWSKHLVREALWLMGGLQASPTDREKQAALYRQQHDWARLADFGAHQHDSALVVEAHGHLGERLNPMHRPLLRAAERHQALQERPAPPRPARRRS